MEIQKLKDIATQLRRDVVRMTNSCGSGHPGGPLGCAEYFTALFFEVMHHNPSNFTMDGKGEDLFFLSNGHLSAGLYSALARSGYFDVKELATHRKINSRLQGHPATEEGLPGVRVATGSLGQGLSVAVGAALTKRMNNDGRLVYALMGDGEQQEGQIWEALTFAAHHKVDNIVAAVDCNNAQIDGVVEEIMDLRDLKAKYEAFGWEVIPVDEGNDMEAVLDALKKGKNATGKGKPVVLMLNTTMGYGVDFMETAANEWHGKAPDDEQTEKALAQLEETLGDY